MNPSKHFIASLFVGAIVWFFARSLYAGLVCLFCGIFLDLDHIIDYIADHGWRNLTYKNLRRACEQTARQEGELQFRKIYLIFHCAEVALMLWLLVLYARNVYLFAGALGYSVHLILDYISNPVNPHSYFITGRAINKFLTKRILQKK